MYFTRLENYFSEDISKQQKISNLLLIKLPFLVNIYLKILREEYILESTKCHQVSQNFLGRT